MRVYTGRTVQKSRFQNLVVLVKTQSQWHWLFVVAAIKILSKLWKLFRILSVTKSLTILWYRTGVKKKEVNKYHNWIHIITRFLDSSKEEKRETQISFCKKCSQPIFGNPIRTSKLEEFEYCTMSCLKVRQAFWKLYAYLSSDWHRCSWRYVEKHFEIGQFSNVGKESQGNFANLSAHHHFTTLKNHI